ncbi:c-type cytochrome [Altericroceibacterium xinjiangense]|uniref:c-type cytochrome n=1 Tax=Altericroceibacterium xinjiangense TaxID=762261 RepID=UPI000F7EA25E|nr:cytochrome c [Altericroceibacterium xinjiangense]
MDLRNKGSKVFAGKMSKVGIAALGLALSAVPLSQFAAQAQAPELEQAKAEAPAGEVDMEAGRQLFQDWSCNACHVLEDAGAQGHVGPALDGNSALTRDLVIDRVTNGAGAMPGFGGQLSEEEIAALADYIVAAHK